MTRADPDPCDPELYFDRPEGSMLIPIELCIRDHVPTDEKLAEAARLLVMARRGEHPRREPVRVRKLAGGRFLVLDGNTTLTVLKSWGCTHLIAVEDAGGT